MPYVAHAGVILSDDYSVYEKDKWYLLSPKNGLHFYRRIDKNNLYEIACELFTDKEVALRAAKNIYTTMLYNLLWKGIHIADGGCDCYEKRLYNPDIDSDITEFAESSFFWTPVHIGGGIGVDVYEVPNSFDEFDAIYKNRSLRLSFSTRCDSLDLEFDNYDTSPFLYDKESQGLLNTVLQADSVFDIGLQMTLYCGLLEHLAPENDKKPEVIAVIDQLIEQVKDSILRDDQKASLTNYLNIGKKESARKRCLMLCNLYAKGRYGKYKTKDIFEDAYSIRSAYSHGANCSNRYSGPAPYIKLVVLDVIKGYMKARQSAT